nr:MAG TPA: hypothetical protein [Caudoviricetes sp.]
MLCNPFYFFFKIINYLHGNNIVIQRHRLE